MEASAGEQGAKDNMYQVSITANGGDPFLLTVEVTNEDEPGTVGLDKPQPQVGRSVSATDFDDPDGTAEKSVLWYSGPSMDGPWTSLEVTNESYTPEPDDAGNYLRVVFTYNDGFGDGKTAEAVSEMPVEAKTLSNAAPVFEGEDAVANDIKTGFQVSRTTKEGAAADSNIGDPISATDADNDVLRYSIVADDPDTDGVNEANATDDEKFKIDAKSGQLMVGTVLDFEPPGSVGANNEEGTANQVYVVTVRVVDPSSASADADVTITLEDVNEPPIFNEASDGRTTVYVQENTEGDNTAVFNAAVSITTTDTDDTGDDVSYVAVDDDGADTITYSLEGSDAALFDIGDMGGAFTKMTDTAVNIDTKASYSLSVIAMSTRGTDDDAVTKYDRVIVTVSVVDANDDGTVSLSQREPQVGKALGASVEDDDGDIGNVEWQWYRLRETDATGDTPSLPADDVACPEEATGPASCVIDGATSASYTPSSHDYGDPDVATIGGRYLAARASYDDKFNSRRRQQGSVLRDIGCRHSSRRSCEHGSGVR